MGLSEAVKKAKAQYHKKWQRENPEKVKAAQERYWLKKAKEIMEKEQNNDSKN